MTSLASKIREEIDRDGAISFARFMEMALYSPELGYYERQRQIGQKGDFFTSASVGNLFGELLAFQFAEWFEKSAVENAKGQKKCLQLVESGTHNGQLALDILRWFKQFRPEIFQNLNYSILEPSPRHRDWQQKTLAEFSGQISWHKDFSEIPRHPGFTIVFSNELFDAMPIHRFGWDAKVKTWFEWGVGWKEDNFVWKRLSENQREPMPYPQLAPELLAVLPDGFTTEICPTASAWWKEAASILDSGKLVAIDYGLRAEEFLTPERSHGTARAYFQHRVTADLLAHPGEQDLTAHVDFTALQEAGETAGLQTDALVSQTKFFMEVLGKIAKRPEKFGEWNEKRAKQFQTLTHPQHLGRSFRVLIQSR